MTKSKYTSRRNARKIWEDHYKCCLLPGMHIHHKDGDPFNNSVDNLMALTPDEHWQLHFDQGDTVALSGKFVQLAANWRGRKHSEVSRQKIRNSKIGIPSKLRGVPRSKEASRKSGLSQMGEKNHRWGKTTPKEGRARIAASLGTKPFSVWLAVKLKPSSYKGLGTFEVGEFVGKFTNVSEACRSLNVPRALIRKCLRGVTPQAKGYVFKWD